MEDLYDGGAGVYSEAKGEYTRQLIQFLTPALSRFFMKLFAVAQHDVAAHGGRGLLAKFQELMSVVPEWNIDKVQRETATVISETKCDYLEELLSAVFIAHTKVLTAIRPNSWKNKKVQIVVPKMDHFVHRAMSECCRLLWKTTYLFQPDLPAVEKQKNYRGIEFQIGDGISNAIRALLPVKNILKDCLTGSDAGADDAEASDSDSDEEEEVKKTEPVLPIVKEEAVKEEVQALAPAPVQEETKEVLKPLDEIKVEKLEEVAAIHSEDGTVDVPGGSTEDMSGNERVFTHKAVKEISVEKMESESASAEAQEPELAPALAQEQTQEPIQPINLPQENIIVDTSDVSSPSVKFNDYDQVYTPVIGGGGSTTLAYAPKEVLGQEVEADDGDYGIDIIGDAVSVLSDFEELDF
jgi:hypothetical protein